MIYVIYVIYVVLIALKRATIIDLLANVLIVYLLDFPVETNFVTDTVDFCNRI